MKLLRLRLLNFRQHADTELELGDGLTGIIGPNGAGKTTLLEAIAFALYGTGAARGTRETIRRRGAGARATVRVELDFRLGAHEYRLARTLSTAELYQDRGSEPVANSLAAVSDRVGRLLGMNRDEFFNTYFTGQKDLAVMAAMTGPERAQFLSRLLGYERLRTAQDRLKADNRARRASLEGLERGLPDPAALEAEVAEADRQREEASAADAVAVEALERADAALAEARPQLDAGRAARDRAQALAAEVRVAEHAVERARERFQELDRSLAEAISARDALAALLPRLAPLAPLRAELQRHAELGRRAADRQQAATRLESARAEAADLEARLAALPTEAAVAEARAALVERRSELEAANAALAERRTAWVRDQQDAQTKRQALRDQYKELEEQRERLVEAGAEGNCPTCGRPLGADRESVLDLLDRQLQEVLFNGKFYAQRVDQLESPPAELAPLEHARAEAERAAERSSSELGGLERAAQEAPALAARLAATRERERELVAALAGDEAPYDPARHRELELELAALDPLEREADRLRHQAARAEALVGEAEAAERILSEQEARTGSLKAELAAVGHTEERWQALTVAHDAAERGRREAELAAAKARAVAESAMRTVEAARGRLAERTARETEIAALRRDLLLDQELDRALADLRTDLNQALRPDLSELAGSFLRDLTQGRYVDLELTEQYEPLLLEDGEPKPVISGGEEDIANLSLRLAISQMIAERAGQPLSMLVLDEIFGSLDEERRQSVLDLLRALGDRFPQVVLITHVESVRDGFDRVLRVAIGPDGSAVVEDETAAVDHVAA